MQKEKKKRKTEASVTHQNLNLNLKQNLKQNQKQNRGRTSASYESQRSQRPQEKIEAARCKVVSSAHDAETNGEQVECSQYRSSRSGGVCAVRFAGNLYVQRAFKCVHLPVATAHTSPRDYGKRHTCATRRVEGSPAMIAVRPPRGGTCLIQALVPPASAMTEGFTGFCHFTLRSAVTTVTMMTTGWETSMSAVRRAGDMSERGLPSLARHTSYGAIDPARRTCLSLGPHLILNSRASVSPA